ncbi:hypothetical protein NQ760_17575, partial [Acinetobacter baumannii]|nr:hypothetical protein [Acinetobacter baumannii]
NRENNNIKPIVNRKEFLTHKKCRCFIGKFFSYRARMIFLLQESTCTSRSAYRLAAARKIKKTSTYTLSENFMESASNTSVILDASAPARRAGMTESEWREAIKFDSTDTGWVIMSIGMAIGAGIVFLPVQVGLMGLWVFLLSSI